MATEKMKSSENERLYLSDRIDLLSRYEEKSSDANDYLSSTSRIDDLLVSHKISASVDNIVETALYIQFEVKMEDGESVDKIKAIKDDIAYALAMSSDSISFDIPVVNKHRLGINVPKIENQGICSLRKMIDSDAFRNSKDCMNFVVGEDMQGQPVIENIDDMPHMLVAGTTGSGKSVFVDGMLLSMMFKYSPEEINFVLIDTLGSTFNLYEGIPYLMMPVIYANDENRYDLTFKVFDKFLGEIDKRIKKLSSLKVRSVTEYNKRVIENPSLGEPITQTVCVIDDIYNLMGSRSEEMQDYTKRITLKARAAGIHLVYVTQYPDKKVLTTSIVRNLCCKVAFKTATSVESTQILGEGGANNLLGNGDMLMIRPGYYAPRHYTGAYVSPDEINAVVDFIKKNK